MQVKHKKLYTLIILTYFIREIITVQLTFCLTGLDSVALLLFNLQQIYMFGQIQISQTGGQSHSDTSPFKVFSELTNFVNIILQKMFFSCHVGT